MKNILSLSVLLVLSLVSSCYAQEVVDEYNYNQNIELTNQGWEIIQSKSDYKKALQLFSQAIDLYDGNTDSYAGLATSYLKLKKYDSARFFVQHAIEISPEGADLHYLAGNIFMKDRGFSDAINEYTEALKLNLESEVKIDLANCYFNRGTAYLFSQKYQEALLDFNETLNLKPFANAYHNRGITYRHLYKKQEACNNFNTAVEMGSEQSEFYVNGYCKGISMETLNTDITKANKVNSQQEIETSDTIKITLYYTGNWKLTNPDSRVCHREAFFNVSIEKFVGPFTDYYPNGRIIVKGQYDSKGKKTGKFERFYEDGNPCSIGFFENDRQVGKWKYFYPNGNFHEEIHFFEENFIVEEYHDEYGKAQVIHGSGIWTRIFPVNRNEKFTLTAPFTESKRADKWKLVNNSNQTILVESYQNGEFQTGKTGLPGQMKKYQKSQFTAALFYPASYAPIEKFEYHSSASREDYPFLTHLPSTKGLPVRKIYADLESSDIQGHDVVYDLVEVAPSPIGGMANFYKYVGKNMLYPNEARRSGIEGRVFVQFVVDQEGKLTEVKTIKGIGGGCNEEAERVIRTAPPWSPGLQRGKPVKVRMILPITFKLSEPVNKPFRMKDRPYSRF